MGNINYKNCDISLMELMPNQYAETTANEGHTQDYKVESDHVWYAAECKYGVSYATTPVDAVELVKSLIDSHS